MGNRSRLLPAVILPVLSFAEYANTLAGGFVYDDISQVLEDLWIRDVREQAISNYRKTCDLGNPQGYRALQRARAGN